MEWNKFKSKLTAISYIEGHSIDEYVNLIHMIYNIAQSEDIELSELAIKSGITYDDIQEIYHCMRIPSIVEIIQIASALDYKIKIIPKDKE